MTAKTPLILMMQAGGQASRIIGFEKGIVYVEAALPIAGQVGDGQLSWRQGALGAAIDVTLAPTEDGVAPERAGVGYRVLGPRNALAVLGKMALEQGKDRYRYLLALDLPPRERPPLAVERRSRAMVAAFAAATLVFGGIVALEVRDRLFSFNAEFARVSAAGEIVRAEKAGRVVFLTDAAEVAAGEPVAGVRTRSGYEQPFVAPVSGEVSSVMVRVGESIGAGEPVLVVSPPGERPTVLARIATADAVRLAGGFEAVVTFADGSSERLPVGPADVIPLGASGGSARVDVRLRPVTDLSAHVGQPVSVQFRASFSPVATPARDAIASRADVIALVEDRKP